MKDLKDFLSIGKVLNFHGIKGEVKIGFTEGNEKIFSDIKEIYIEKNSEILKFNIETIRFHKKFALIKFKEINSVDEAIKIKDGFLKLQKNILNKYLVEDEFYITDLEGLKAYDTEGNLLGVVSGVVNVKGQDSLFIKNERNKEYMVPFTKQIVPEISLEKKKIVIKKIEGLFED
ncbi:MAG TPA: ribosome maturation factor RimM [Candidatus Gastranaerophilales bacterium]|nr:ribosome maturation factor RimM [Candidatus Gastranaerophilales bacterium]